MKRLCIFFLFAFPLSVAAQLNEDSVFIARIFDEALSHGRSYPDLRDLCKQAGPRLSGSKSAEMAVDLTEKKMQGYGFDSVFRQPVMVPHWERGECSFLQVSLSKMKKAVRPMPVCALGGSVAGNVEGEIIEVLGWTELNNLDPEKIKGKIVFFNRPMDPRIVYTFGAYGTCVDQRAYGAVWASLKGARAVIVRSMNLRIDDYPHTGNMVYSDTVGKIPAVAISTQAADELSGLLKEDPLLKISYTISPTWYPNALSHNVIGQLNGKRSPGKFIVVGGHLDSWDLAEGAHDDGAGCIQSIEVLRLLRTLGYQPNNSLRAVMWMNEENGLRGALEYARAADSLGEKHLMAIEADRGAFAPRGFFIQGTPEQIARIQQWLPLLEPYGIHVLKGGGAGADVGPLQQRDEQTVLIGFVPDSQRYFDVHHASTDTFESVNQRELELGAAALASLMYLADKYW